MNTTNPSQPAKAVEHERIALKMLVHKSLAVALASAALASVSEALPVNEAVPSNAYISFNGLEWAWATKVQAPGISTPTVRGRLDLTFQGPLGWRLPTADELTLAPQANDFIFAGANVPYGGTDPVSGASFNTAAGSPSGVGACAAPYFNATYTQCDWGNAPGSGGTTVVPWWGQVGAQAYSETLVVREVPEPASYALLAFGLAGLGVALRRRLR